MRSERVLPVGLEADAEAATMTGLAGMMLVVELACQLGMLASADRHVGLQGAQGWLDRQMLLALVLLNLAGGDAVDDIERLEADAGLGVLVRAAERQGLDRAQRQDLAVRFRRGRSRTFPSPTRLHGWLERCHDAGQEALRPAEGAFVPAPSAPLRGLGRVNQDLLAGVQARRRERCATLDVDATLVATTKREALYCYEKYKAYQPLTVYWAEQQMVVHSDFRDGNVPAGWQLARVLEEARAMLPAGVEQLCVRSDSAGYQHEVLRWCEEHGARYAVVCDVTAPFRAAVAEVPERAWQPVARDGGLPPTHEWADVVYVPQGEGACLTAPTRRYVAVRELLRQPVLPGTEEQGERVVSLGGRSYKLRGLVSNRLEDTGGELVRWLWARCGKGEEVHALLKRDLAGGTLPSGRFGANAAWWAVVVLAANLRAALGRLVLGPGWANKRLKALRLGVLSQPGRLVRHAGGWCLRVSAALAAWWGPLRAEIASWEPVPT